MRKFNFHIVYGATETTEIIVAEDAMTAMIKGIELYKKNDPNIDIQAVNHMCVEPTLGSRDMHMPNEIEIMQ